MKTHINPSIVPALLGVVFTAELCAQGTAFTYQGRLDNDGAPYTGIAEFQATLWDAASGGTALASNSPVSIAVGVTNGLFVLPLDFGGNFPGADRWLQLEVRTTIGSFTVLTPRQQLTPAPYAMTAGNLTGTLPATQLSGTVADERLSGGVSLLGASIESVEITDGTIVNADIADGAAIVDTKLATIATAGKVADSALSASVSLLGQTIEAVEITDGTIVAADVNAASFSTTFWRAGGNAGTTPGTHFLGTTDTQPVEFKVNNQRGLRLEYVTDGFLEGVNLIGGYSGNSVGAGTKGAVIAGGGRSGGEENTVGIGSDHSVIGGGFDNNVASDSFGGTIAGGVGNDIGVDSDYSAIGGGSVNDIAGNADYATIPGGQSNFATNYAFAAGRRAKANHTGAFVWADSQNADFVSERNNQFRVRAAGGARFDVNGDAWVEVLIKGSLFNPPFKLIDTSAGGYLSQGGAWVDSSDRNRKENFEPVSATEILGKVAELPITTWNYKAEESSVRHIGPVAQDFHAAFGVGADDKHLAALDVNGVALAAIQGLNEKVEDRSQRSEDRSRRLEERLQQKETEITELKRRLVVLERIILNHKSD